MKGKKCCNESMKDIGLLALRIAVGLIFIVHGWAKLNGIEGTGAWMSSLGLPLSGTFWAWLVGLVEFLGGLAVLLGFYTSMAAKLLAINMLLALLLAHLSAPWAKAELAIALLGGSLALSGLGGGKWKLTKRDCPCVGKK
jgi:putative oxidoreductase